LPFDKTNDSADSIYSFEIELEASERVVIKLPNTKKVINTNSANSELGKMTLNNNAKKKNEKYLKGLEILIIPLKFKIIFRKILIKNSIINIAKKIAGNKIAVVSNKPFSKLYSVISEAKDSSNIDGFGIML